MSAINIVIAQQLNKKKKKKKLLPALFELKCELQQKSQELRFSCEEYFVSRYFPGVQWLHPDH